MRKRKLKPLKIDTIKNRLRTSTIIVAITAIALFVNSSFLYMESEADTIQNAKWDLHLKPSTGPMEVVDDMHEMTHQFVEADRKWGATPMCDDTINQVYNYVSTHNNFDSDSNDSYLNYYDEKQVLLDILDKWKKHDFSNIVEDHNTLWNMLDGDVGKATGKATKEEEAEYVVLHFGSRLKLFR